MTLCRLLLLVFFTVRARVSHTRLHGLEQLNAAFVVTHAPNAERSATKRFGLAELNQPVGTMPERRQGCLEEVPKFLWTL